MRRLRQTTAEQQARKKAQHYLNYTLFSHSELVKQFEFEASLTTKSDRQ